MILSGDGMSFLCWGRQLSKTGEKIGNCIGFFHLWSLEAEDEAYLLPRCKEDPSRCQFLVFP